MTVKEPRAAAGHVALLKGGDTSVTVSNGDTYRVILATLPPPGSVVTLTVVVPSGAKPPLDRAGTVQPITLPVDLRMSRPLTVDFAGQPAATAEIDVKVPLPEYPISATTSGDNQVPGNLPLISLQQDMSPENGQPDYVDLPLAVAPEGDLTLKTPVESTRLMLSS